jgi:rSAM/selenodomain-associated transferase 2
MKISVVIPTLNEAACLGAAVAALRALPGELELLVADGGSSDDTLRIARDLGVRVIAGARGRGLQMNLGASQATAEVLLFLHADTLLPRDAHARIAAALRDPATIGGCFRLGFDTPNPLLRSYAFFTRFRFRLFHYGDQAFFVRAATFRELGGYRPYPIMEDLDFWLRLVQAGRVVVLDEAVVSSARRYSRCGVVRQQLVNFALVVLFFLGVSPFTLSRFYQAVR